jgi:hypothetical protein
MDMALVVFGAALVLILALPLIVASGSAYVWRKQLSRPWWYWLAATVVLYGVYALSMTWFPPVGGISISAADTTHPASHEPVLWMVLAPFRQGFTEFIIGAVPTVAALVWLFRRVAER